MLRSVSVHSKRLVTFGVRLGRHVFLLTYLVLTFCALYYTLGHQSVPRVPWPLITHFYAMMAPFQTYVTQNTELMIYGKYADGSWRKIDHETYFPFSRGEYAIRSRLSGVQDMEQKYEAIAAHILQEENRKGAGFVAVRIQWEQWPVSELSFYGHYDAEHVTKTFVTEFPSQ